MRVLISIAFVFLLFAFQNCNSKGKEAQSWLNIEYIECIKNSLPCECEKSIRTYYSLVLESDAGSKNFGIALSNFEEMEPHIYPIKNTAPNEYVVLKSRDDTSIWAKVIVKENELRFIEGNSMSKFIKSKKSNSYDLNHYYKENVALLNEAFTARSYPRLEQIVNENNLNCTCNKWMGGINLLSVQGAPQAWTIELRNDSLLINRVINIDKDPDDPLQTERLAGYKWK